MASTVLEEIRSLVPEVPKDFGEYGVISKEKYPVYGGKLCFRNAFLFGRSSGVRMAVGIHVRREDLDKARAGGGLKYSMHSWNVDKDGSVIDTTLGANDGIYIGKTVEGGVVRNEMWLRERLLKSMGV
jgi:hypothetical protein